MTDNTITLGVAGEVLKERRAQDEKWGEQNHDALYWLGILTEEVGEVAKAAIEHRGEDCRMELIHVAAVAQAAAECFDRRAIGEASASRVTGRPATPPVLPGTRVREIDSGGRAFEGTVMGRPAREPERVWVQWQRERMTLGDGLQRETTVLVGRLEILDARA